MISIQVALLVLSIGALYFGAEFALDSAEKIGRFFGMSPLVIGLLIVGFGTSLPEFFVSQLACYRGHPNIALGNIIGSNIANLFLILGVSGTIETLFILRKEITHQFIFHLIITAILIGILLYQKINFVTLGVLVLFFASYLRYTFKEMKIQRKMRQIKDEDIDSPEEFDEAEKLSILLFGKLIIGFGLLYAGGELLVSSGTTLAKLMGIDDYIISAIFVAFGTSFPELVTALIAVAKKKNTDIITGNIIGSNIFNVAFVMGSLGFYNISIQTPFKVEMITLGVAAVFLLALPLVKKNFGRPAGILFLASYIGMVFHWIR